MSGIFCDWKRNRRNIKGKIIMVSFRIANLATTNRFVFYIMIPYLVCYRLFVEWFLGVELPWKTKVGKGLRVFHGQALVINDGSVIGENVTIRHCTTIGNKQVADGSFSRCPVIGNNVEIGSNVCIIGNIRIGDNVSIGAGSVVVKDVLAGSIVVGNPARTIKRHESTDFNLELVSSIQNITHID
ncbi:MAG: serine acetyltransferase [Bacteroidetes bacterium]|nr:MAG: serine acetyltransferase [Bacteroidota bacterium]